MSASDRIGVRALLALGALFVGCSLVTDFDAGKIPPGGKSGAAGGLSPEGFHANGGAGVSSGGSGVSGGSGGSGASPSRPDASFGGSSGGGTPLGSGGMDAMQRPACDVATNGGCAPDELCCAAGQGVTCRKTSLKECERCGVACPADLAAACGSRKCECAAGAQRACSGKDAERFCGAGPPASCVACRDATDCLGRTDGNTRCVAGQCARCDPAQANAGCTGNTPICDPGTHTCKACTTSPDNCLSPLVCAASGACGNCADAGDCRSPTSPICDPASTECRPCASNAECAAGPKLPYCVGQTCSTCNPSTEEGCADPAKPDCRGDAAGGYSCQPCTNDAHCANRPGAPVCDRASGRCAVCVVDNDCANPKAPFCENNACVSCGTTSPIALVTDLRCLLKAGGQPACIRSGTQQGQCGECDPGGSRGCNGNQLCCENAGVAACARTSTTVCSACTDGACDPLVSNLCVGRTCQCGSNAACAGTGQQRFCLASGACAECRTDADCASATAPLCEGNRCVGCNQAASAAARCAAETAGTVCATSGAQKGRCATCDPATSAGCGDATLNQCDPATASCVDCVDNAGCSGTLDRCNVATHKCVDCVDDVGCADVPTKPICAANVCRACASDAECAGTPGSGGPLCAATGACVPDSACARQSDCTDGGHRVCVGLGADGGGLGHCRACNPATAAGCAPGQTCAAAFVCTG